MADRVGYDFPDPRHTVQFPVPPHLGQLEMEKVPEILPVPSHRPQSPVPLHPGHLAMRTSISC